VRQARQGARRAAIVVVRGVAVRALSGRCPGPDTALSGVPDTGRTPGHADTGDRGDTRGTRLAVPSAMVKITMELPDVEVWRAVQLAALAAVTRHARRARPEVGRRFAAAAAALQQARVAPLPSTPRC